MIKINLLPSTKKRKGVTLSITIKPTFLFLVIIVLVIFILEGVTWYWLGNTVAALSEERQTLQVRLNEVKEKVKEVENFEKDKKLYEEKIAIIQKLKENQKGPVRILDELSRKLPDRVWLRSLKEDGGGIIIAGAGITNDDIVRYVNNLKGSRFFSKVQLLESRQVVESGIPIYSFSLTISVKSGRV